MQLTLSFPLSPRIPLLPSSRVSPWKIPTSIHPSPPTTEHPSLLHNSTLSPSRPSANLVDFLRSVTHHLLLLVFRLGLGGKYSSARKIQVVCTSDFNFTRGLKDMLRTVWILPLFMVSDEFFGLFSCRGGTSLSCEFLGSDSWLAILLCEMQVKVFMYILLRFGLVGFKEFGMLLLKGGWIPNAFSAFVNL